MRTAAPGTKIGLLGGGQLARMLALAAHQKGMMPYVMSPKADDPAGQVTKNHVEGRLDQLPDLVQFLKSVDVATFENEFLDANLLEQASQQSHTPLYPHPQVMAKVQDRLSQKQLLNEFHLPTAAWRGLDQGDSYTSISQDFGSQWVLKKRRFGYDGYGTYIIKEKAQWEHFHNQLLSESATSITDYIVEKWVPFQRELAFIVARNPSSEVVFFPLVETFQENARCLWVKGPVDHPRLAEMQDSFGRFLNATEYVGVMGIELFELNGEILVNELAPRVHNSGHYSQDSLDHSQFEIHLRCLLNESLPTPQLKAPAFAMYNLLGTGVSSLNWLTHPGAILHWYGKSENRAGRKMGHLNTVAETPEQALANLEQIRRLFQI